MISGYVKDSSGIGIEGVNVSADNGGGSDTTDINGYYEITVPYDWSGTVTPNKAGWNITPSSQSYINVASDQTNQDFTGFQPTISGSTGISGATVTFSGIGSVVSTPLYSITVPYGWSGTAEATLAEYNFPESPRDHTNVTTDMTGQDFTPYQPTISGYVKDGSGGSIEGVSVSADNGGGSDTTDATGYYEITIPYGWSGTVTPNRLGWQITPSERNYSNVVADQLSQDFLAVYIGIIVKKDGTGDFITIQSAIDAAVPADRIIVYQGTYYENINFNGKNIVLTSTDPNDPNVVASTIINANGSGSVVIFAGSESQSCLLTGFTITGGNSNYYGGGVYGLNTRATITNCIISGNSAIYYGGGLYNCNGTINNCTISGNSASEGGGLYACGGTINNCMISSNSADYGGGLFYCGGTISNCTISGNSANYHGGGLYSCGGVIENCTISGNLANYNGGGLYSCGGVIENCKISDNSANYGGGLFHCNGTINNCTITSNSANYGGGLRNCNGSISNCIIWGNNRTQVSDSSIPSYSCIENWSGGGVGNITEDPVFVNEPNNYHLSGYSPCIDAGDPYYAAEPNETDIDGDPRVMGRIDMGADEVYSSTSALLVIIPGTLNFVAEEMSSGEQSQQISIKNYGAEILNWELSEPNDCNWLNVFPTSGQLNTAESNDVEITVNQNIAGYGTHSCQLQVTAPDAQNSPQVVTVNLEVLRPQIGTNKDYFYFTAHGKSDTSVAGQELVITNTGFDTLNWHIETPNDCNWLSITPQSGQVTDGNSTVTLSVDPNKAPLYGYNYCTLHVIDPNASNSPQAVEVRLNIYGPSIYV
ncbi:MAG: BACON domain-containing protein, partial [Planctomycetota bacterium]